MSLLAKKIAPVFALAALFTFALGDEAQAQYGCHHGGGIHYGGAHHGGIHQSSGHFVQPSPYVTNYPVHPSYPSYPSYPSNSIGHGYHDTSHVDYHGPSLVPHNGHFDYQPGHYDVHQSGHWH